MTDRIGDWTYKPTSVRWVSVMNEIEVVRLNIERFRRMLETESDATVRQTIQKMLDEFQDRLTSLRNRDG